MSFSTNDAIVVADATPANVTYSEQQKSGLSSVYSDRTRGLGVPRTLSISHQETGKGDAIRTRSLVKFADTQENPDMEGDRESATVYLVVDYPSRIFSTDHINHMVVQMKNFMISADFLAKLINREI